MNKLEFFIFSCEGCGRSWVGPRSCCGRKCAEAPLQLYTVADSLSDVCLIRFSVLLPLDEGRFRLRQSIAQCLKSMAGESIEFVLICDSISEDSLLFIRRTANLNIRLLRVSPKDSLARRYNL